MQIIEITISYEATQSLSDYSNVRPGIRLTVRLDEGDDPVITQQALLNEVRTIIHKEIDDCLIADGKAPRYYMGQRYQVVYNMERHIIALLPDETKPVDLPGPGSWFHEAPRRLRLDQARRIAHRFAGDREYQVMDCCNGDLSHLAEPASKVSSSS